MEGSDEIGGRGRRRKLDERGLVGRRTIVVGLQDGQGIGSQNHQRSVRVSDERRGLNPVRQARRAIELEEVDVGRAGAVAGILEKRRRVLTSLCNKMQLLIKQQLKTPLFFSKRG